MVAATKSVFKGYSSPITKSKIEELNVVKIHN